MISKIPTNIIKLENLRFLDLRYNSLDDLPDELFQMKNLETLDVTDNKFEKIPEVLYKMKGLKTLRIGFNKYEWKDNEKIKKQLSLLKEALPNTKIF